VKDAAGKAGNAAKVAGVKTKLRTEMLMLDREINSRKLKFGVEMYDHVHPMTETADFYASDDTLTNNLRPPLITANREIKALLCKRGKLQEEYNTAKVTRAAAFPTKATTIEGKAKNAAKSASLAGAEAKIWTELNLADQNIMRIKHEFGLELFPIFSNLEDSQGWLPTDRDIRAIYDQARRDIDGMNKKKEKKNRDLAVLCETGYVSPEAPGGNGNPQMTSSRPDVFTGGQNKVDSLGVSGTYARPVAVGGQQESSMFSGAQSFVNQKVTQHVVSQAVSQSVSNAFGGSATTTSYTESSTNNKQTGNAPKLSNNDMMLFQY